jgi:tetratricopeptide (TPR) repeat protein
VTPRTLKDKANQALARGRFEQAEVLIRQALTRLPRDAALWVKHADTLRRLHRLRDAVASYRMAAAVYSGEGHDHRAVAALKVALDLLPEDVDLIADLIRVEMHRTRRAEAPRLSPNTMRVSLNAEAEPPEPQPLLALPALPSSPSEFAASIEAASIELEVETGRRSIWPQVRRLSDREIAIKASADARWIVVSAPTPLDVRFEANLDIDDIVPWLE